jgi:hypothetical protein
MKKKIEMKEQQDKQQYIENCKELIELIGRKQIRTECEISLQSLNYWLNHGIPRAWFQFLSQTHKEAAKQVFQGRV